jgi:hypothetical protein
MISLMQRCSSFLDVVVGLNLGKRPLCNVYYGVDDTVMCKVLGFRTSRYSCIVCQSDRQIKLSKTAPYHKTLTERERNCEISQ